MGLRSSTNSRSSPRRAPSYSVGNIHHSPPSREKRVRLLGARLLDVCLGPGRFVIANGLRALPDPVLPQLPRQYQLRRRVEMPFLHRLPPPRYQQFLLRLRCELVHHVDAEVVHDPHGFLRDADGGMGLLVLYIRVGLR